MAVKKFGALHDYIERHGEEVRRLDSSFGLSSTSVMSDLATTTVKEPVSIADLDADEDMMAAITGLVAKKVGMPTEVFASGTVGTSTWTSAFGETSTMGAPSRIYDSEDRPAVPEKYAEETFAPPTRSGTTVSECWAQSVRRSLLELRKIAPDKQPTRLKRTYAIAHLNRAELQEQMDEALHMVEWRRNEFGYSRHRLYQDALHNNARHWDEDKHKGFVAHLNALADVARARRATEASDPVDTLPSALLAELEAQADDEALVAGRHGVW